MEGSGFSPKKLKPRMIVPREGYREDTARYSQAQQQDGKQWTQLVAKRILVGIREERCSQGEGLALKHGLRVKLWTLCPWKV